MGQDSHFTAVKINSEEKSGWFYTASIDYMYFLQDKLVPLPFPPQKNRKKHFIKNTYRILRHRIETRTIVQKPESLTEG